MTFTEYSAKMYFKGSQLGIPKDIIDALLTYAERLYALNLPIIYEQEHLALLCGKDYAYLLGISNQPSSYYKRYLLPKRSGGFRTIMEPLPSLKEIQEWILRNVLYRVIGTHVAKNSKGFIPGIGIKENVRFHRNKELVVNMDLTDFFGSIGFKEVFDVFTGIGYNKSVSVLLTNLCICENCLPQGAPTSPMLSNMVFKRVDDKIFEYCRKNSILFTRYADDMTFSGSFNISGLKFFIENTLSDTPFRINHKKTKIYKNAGRQLVTNIVVNEKIQLPRYYRRRIRQEVYYISKYGISKHLSRQNLDIDPLSYIMHLRGQVNYCIQINPKDQEMYKYRNILYCIYKAIESPNSIINNNS